MEWAIFRASDGPDGTPVESWRYKTPGAAQKTIDKSFTQPELWEVRGREVGEWKSNETHCNFNESNC